MPAIHCSFTLETSEPIFVPISETEIEVKEETEISTCPAIKPTQTIFEAFGKIYAEGYDQTFMKRTLRRF